MICLLVVMLSSLVHVCTGAPYDVSYLKMGTKDFESRGYGVSIYSNGDAVLGGFTYGNSSVDKDWQVLVQRYSSTGNLIWTTKAGGTSTEVLRGVAVDKKDNTFATGTSTSDYNGVAAGRKDVFIAKFDASGATSFYSQFGGSGDDNAAAVAVDSTGSFFYVVGNTESRTFNGVTRVGRVDGFITKISAASGAVEKQFNVGCESCSTTLNAATFDSAGNLWVTGAVTTWPSTTSTYYGRSPVGTQEDVIIQKFDVSTGKSVFLDLVGGVLKDIGNSIAIDAKDNVYVAATTLSTSVDGQTMSGDGRYILVVKYNSAGVKQWTRLYGGTGDNISAGITVDSTGLIYLTGNTNSRAFYGHEKLQNMGKAFLLVLNAANGQVVHSSIYRSPSSSQGEAIATNGVSVYIAGTAEDKMLDQSAQGSAIFLLQLGGHSPSCVQWALGDYGETCSTTCNKLSLQCKDAYFSDVVTQEAFYAVVASSVDVRSGAAVGSAESFCSQGTTFAVPVEVPAAFSFLQSTTSNAPARTTCSFPTSSARATCDAALNGNFARRFCPCVDSNCDGGWFLGHAGDSCDATCANVGGECDAAPLATINDAASFSAMVATATALDTNQVISESGYMYCTEGTNLYNFASAPAAITMVTSVGKQTMCAFPTPEHPLDGACDKSFQEWPAQRFCNCKVNVGARKKAEKPKKSDSTPMLRGYSLLKSVFGL